jgi:hypothetical protein
MGHFKPVVLPGSERWVGEENDAYQEAKYNVCEGQSWDSYLKNG